MDLLDFFQGAGVRPAVLYDGAPKKGLNNVVEAGKGKARSKDRQVRPQGGQPADQVGQEPDRNDQQPLPPNQTPVTFHPKVAKDILKLSGERQDKAEDIFRLLESGKRHSTTHPLNRLKGWDSTKIDSRHIVIHQKRDKGLFVGYVGGQHDYEAARRRLSSLDLVAFFDEDDDEHDEEPGPYCSHCDEDGHDESDMHSTCRLCGGGKNAEGAHIGTDDGKCEYAPKKTMEEKEDEAYDKLDPSKYCGEGCRSGHASDIAHGVGFHHTFNIDEHDDWHKPRPDARPVPPGSSSPHAEPFARQRSGYEVRNPDDFGLCHYCRAPLKGGLADQMKSLKSESSKGHHWIDSQGEHPINPDEHQYGTVDVRKVRKGDLFRYDFQKGTDMPFLRAHGDASHDENYPSHYLEEGEKMWLVPTERGFTPHQVDHTRMEVYRPRQPKESALDFEALKAPHWKQDFAWLPNDRIFAPGKGGLDPRLFDPKTRIMLPEVKEDTLSAVASVFAPKYGRDWANWARVYLAGSQASEWWGNNDFDILIGINHSRIRREVPQFKDMTPDEIDRHLTSELKEALNDEEYKPPWDDDIWHRTFFCNPNSWDIRNIKPYAAYEIISQQWFVEPVHAGPDWSALKLPEELFIEGEAINMQIDAIEKMPEPQRSGRGAALWDYLHNDRGRAFSDQGEGVFDPGNAVWKYLDMHPSQPLTRLLDLKREHLKRAKA